MSSDKEQGQVDTSARVTSGSEETAVLDGFAANAAQLRRRAYAEETRRQRPFTRLLVETIPDAAEKLRGLGSGARHETDGVRDVVRGHALPSQQQFMDSPHQLASGGLTVRGKPFDFEWTARRDFGSPDADKATGLMELSVHSGGGGEGDVSTWIGAGVGVRFRPRSGSTYVRVAPYLRYQYRWHDDSTLEVAHNRGELCVLVEQIGTGEILIDQRNSLWNDGTSWYQTHSDEGNGVYADSTYFFASSNHEYAVWFWFNSSIDYNSMGGVFDFGSSRADNYVGGVAEWVVFEQWS